MIAFARHVAAAAVREQVRFGAAETGGNVVDYVKEATSWLGEKAESGLRWLGASRVAFVLPGMLFLGGAGELSLAPENLFETPFVNLGLPSEKAIPEAVPARSNISPDDPVWQFRYAATGTDLRAGIPYWIFSIMPRIYDEVFLGGGYERFGFDDDDHDYYTSRPVPRGMVLSDSVVNLGPAQVGAQIKRVSVNCSGCHRGEYADGSGKLHLVDGMPNHSADLQRFKRFFASAFQDERFTGERVVREINALLARNKSPRLEPREEFFYRGLVDLLKLTTRGRPTAWMDSRADNGPGRIDPFNAVKFEVLKAPDDLTAATLDFPSIWNQRHEIRSWHHVDGNTSDSSARNFGSVIGVGGTSLSVQKTTLNAVGRWIDVLPPPTYPFAKPAPEQVEKGLAVFKESCVMCHGLYRDGKLDRSDAPNYMRLEPRVETDAERLLAFPQSVADQLNDYGERRGLWPKDAFRGDAKGGEGGYLCGPLDGIWARAPYLHNGSVPNISELLKPPGERVKDFWRGNHHYDEAHLGWVSDQPTDGVRPLFHYRTERPASSATPASPDQARAFIPGNSNQGHPYAVSDVEKRDALIAYLKTL